MVRTAAVISMALGFGLSSGMEDGAALVQAGVKSHQQSAARSVAGAGVASRLEMLAKVAALAGQNPLGPVMETLNKGYDCDSEPRFCQEPFNCQDFKMAELFQIPFKGVAPDGKLNMHLWCEGKMYAPYMHACLVEKDLIKAAKVQYDWSVAANTGVDEADASYCFIEGHCSNEAVTNETTLEEATQMCDERYGRDGWSKLGNMASLMTLTQEVSPNIPSDMHGGFHDTRVTAFFLKMACAMGNYHCDVMYCKETYCKNPYYLKKYSHLLPKAPGHLLQSKDWVN